MSAKNIANKHRQTYLGNTISHKTRAPRQTCSFDVPCKIKDKRETIVHSNVSEKKISSWVIEKKNETLSVWTPSLPSLLLKSSSTSCQFTRKETDVVIPFP